MANKPRAKQEKLMLETLEPVDAPPEKKSGTRSSELSKVAEQLRAAPNQWFRFASGKTQSSYQKRKRLQDMSNGDGKFIAEVRATEGKDGYSDVYAVYRPADSQDGS